jgi:hypothetical protein
MVPCVVVPFLPGRIPAGEDNAIERQMDGLIVTPAAE